jgi:hypothetical protein
LVVECLEVMSSGLFFSRICLKMTGHKKKL